jgi:hypothetical protein
MKKRILTLSLLVATVLGANETFRTEVDVTAGYNKFDSASRLDSTTFYGIRATMYETEVNRYGLQLGYEGAFGTDYEKSKLDTDIYRLYTHLVVDGETEYRVTPYILLGGGYEYLSDEIKGETSQGFVDLGIGFKYHLNDYLSILFETRGIGKFDTRDLGFNTNLGLGYTLGGTYKEKIKPIEALDKKSDVSEKIAPSHNRPKLDTDMSPVKFVTTKEHRPVKFEKIVVDSRSDARYENEVDAYVKEESVAALPQYDTKEAAISDDFYVQVAAYNVTDPEPLMKRLADKGYDNALLHQRGTTTLVLVGPYVSAKEANRIKRSLRSIKSDAFVTKID